MNMSEAIGAYRHVSVSPEFREIERMMSKARHDEAQALRNTKLQIARNMKAEGFLPEVISRITDLTEDDVKAL